MNKPIYSYEDLSNVDHTKSVFAAEKSISNGWERRGYPGIVLDNIPWHLRKPEERSWNFLIHCWDMLDSLFKAYGETSDEKYLKVCINVVKSWINYAENTVADDLSPMVWYDMAIGLRAYRLAYLIDAVEKLELLDVATQASFWQVLEQHQAQLADDANIIFYNNHGFYQVAGQLAMGRRFAVRSHMMAQAYDQGRQRLKIMLQTQFSEDGVHREHSPDYHRMVYDTLKAMIDAGLVTDDETIAFALRIEEALSWFVLPDQHITNFGDSDYRLMARKPAEAERKWQTPGMQFVVSNGKVGSLSAEKLRVFPHGGYAVVRQADPDRPNEFKEFSYLAQIAAFHSRTHKHADDLSFIWSDRGSEILVDAGRYGYIGKAEQGSDLWLDGHWYADPNRVYCESTRAHNTLEFDGKNYLRKGAKTYGSALKRWTEDASGMVAVETECKHFGSIQRARVLVFMPSKWLIVFDWFNDNAQQPHEVKQWFHLAPHLQLHLERGGYLVSVPPSTQPLRIVSLLDKTLASRPYLGEEKPVMQGWWSAKERDIVPNYAFCFEQSGVETGVFATLFSFSNSLTPDTSWSKVNVSGRKGQFRWTDELGNHVVRLARPSEGKLDVTYACT